MPDAEARDAAFAVFRRLAAIEAASVGAEGEAEGIPFLRFDPDAQDAFTEWRGVLEGRLRGGELHAVMEAHLAKYRSLVPSLALVFHLVDVGVGPVGEASLQRALAWAEYLESHAKRLYAGALGGDLEAARLLGRRIERGELGRVFDARTVYRKGWAGLALRETVRAALVVLCDLNWLREEAKPTPGRTGTLYRVNPAAMGGVR